jgi:poly [ADP-ribose] polymerase 1
MEIARQTTELVRIRQALQRVCSKEDLQFLLIMNECDVIEGTDDVSSLLDRCADILTFGSLYKCQKCKKGDMMFSKYGYTCNAWIDEWVKCGNTEESPLRMKCILPDDLKQNTFFASFEPKAINRAVRPNTAGDEDEPMPSIKVGNSTVAKNIRYYRFENLQLKDGTAVDPKSRLEKIAHVYSSDKGLFNSVLGFTDIQSNKNSFFKLQVLESDKTGYQGLMSAVQFLGGMQNVHNYWLFTSWGRTGTNIGGSKVDVLGSADLAITQFEKIYMEQTGNEWKLRANFKKLPGKFYPIDINYSDRIETNTKIASKLAPQVKELMKMIFDVNNMQMTMEEFKLDMQKMPLGKLSVNQLQAAYEALSEIQNAINAGSSSNKLVGLSNKFFTLIPHNFGLEKAPVLDTLKKINKKMDLVDSLLDIQNAFAIMNKAPKTAMNSYDAYYKQLNADIQCLDRNSTDFKLIETYIKNTSMGGQKLIIEDAFTIQRHGEKERFAKFKNLHNRQLLWHGSPATNFVSIIKNGLKNPQNRGIFFADMISKSIAYCRVMPPQNALLTLSEVALGDMNEGMSMVGGYGGNRTKAAKTTYHSTKMSGKPQPDMKKAHIRSDGVIIPLGRPVNANMNQPSMHMESEFIIQNEAQVHMQYLVNVKFAPVKVTTRNLYPF